MDYGDSVDGYHLGVRERSPIKRSFIKKRTQKLILRLSVGVLNLCSVTAAFFMFINSFQHFENDIRIANKIRK